MSHVRILISAGEASGEMYGALVMEALRRRAGESPSATTQDQQPEFFGVGGDRMRAAGCDTVVDARDLAVVGISEILGHLPKIWGLFHKLIAEADKRRPDLAIVIDSPAFNWRVARQMHKGGIPVVYYVCPQFWAWRQGRVRLLRKYVDKALVIFPFEEKFYRDRGSGRHFSSDIRWLTCRSLKIDRAAYAGAAPARPREALDHSHAGQPGERSAHEFAGDSGIGYEIRSRLRISVAGRADAGSRFSCSR